MIPECRSPGRRRSPFADRTVNEILTTAHERIGAAGRDRDSIPSFVRRLVYLRDNHTCAWCGDRARATYIWGDVCGCDVRNDPHRHAIKEVANFELDHVIPHSAGGCDHAHNLRILCRSCNNRRSNRQTDMHQWRLPVTPFCAPCLTEERSQVMYEEDFAEYLLESASSTRSAAFCGHCTSVSWVENEGDTW